MRHRSASFLLSRDRRAPVNNSPGIRITRSSWRLQSLGGLLEIRSQSCLRIRAISQTFAWWVPRPGHGPSGEALSRALILWAPSGRQDSEDRWGAIFPAGVQMASSSAS